MSTADVIILSRTPFMDTTDPKTPKGVVRIVYQLPDTRIGSVVIPAKDVKTEAENKAIAEDIKKLPESAIERKTIKL